MASAAAAATATTSDTTDQPFFPDEPDAPILRTEIPGPKSTEAIKRLTKVFDTRSLNMMADYRHSIGN